MPINSKAFSLIELLIVITIIGLLTAIAIPSFETYITKTKNSRNFHTSRYT